ncbi:transcriptional regulator [Paramagnetospirillum marisnigri]|uniref:Transcriptional regulator n=1 Tax=Paramagnetospirillum marisnigri TaxID=1285242 RepID=A0A178MCB3_9PROT|nr:LysR substrate-binding domain-containing protein [Paramagnetospirillum marisnigri]OAN45673.1 transcriptional regulator [Paramagnetospirillum marisnigri]OAN45695.1 transcriptional regulator [Paramagnetospirillum marisnigri]
MDIRQLRYFLGIVEHGSLTRAAEALRVAQPALSLHLKRLEEEIGCPLVHRTARGVVPTESGQRLALRAAMLVDQVSGLRDEIRGLEAAPSGPTVIGIPTSLGPMLTAPLVMDVRRRYPAIRLRVVEGLSGHMLEWVSSGKVDMALVFGAEPPPGLATRFVARERLGLVAPKGDETAAGRDRIELAAALELPLILPGHPHGLRVEVERAAASMGTSAHVVVEVDALEQIKALVAKGAGYTVLSERYARSGPEASGLVCIPIVAPEIERTISLAHSADRPLSIAARAVHAIALEQLGRLTHDGRWM